MEYKEKDLVHGLARTLQHGVTKQVVHTYPNQKRYQEEMHGTTKDAITEENDSLPR